MPYQHQRGNALFLILIAVALFAALSYAITQSGRGGSNADKETAAIKAAQMTQYVANLRAAVTRFTLSGVAVTNLSFETDSNNPPCDTAPETCIFHPTYGMAANAPPPTGIGSDINNGDVLGGSAGGDTNLWGYKDVRNGEGFYIKDVGSNADGTGQDAFAFLKSLSLGVCQQINKGLGLGTSIGQDTGDVDYATAQSVYNLGKNVHDGSAGNPAACVGDAADITLLHFYQTLIER